MIRVIAALKLDATRLPAAFYKSFFVKLLNAGPNGGSILKPHYCAIASAFSHSSIYELIEPNNWSDPGVQGDCSSFVRNVVELTLAAVQLKWLLKGFSEGLKGAWRSACNTLSIECAKWHHGDMSDCFQFLYALCVWTRMSSPASILIRGVISTYQTHQHVTAQVWILVV